MAKSEIRSPMARASMAIALGFMAFVMTLAPRDARSLEFNLYGVEIFVDTTLSMGVSVRTAKRDYDFVGEANGGPRELRDLVGGTYAGPTGPGGVTYLPAMSGPPTAGGSGVPQFQVYNDSYPFNFDPSINVDDSRLNFDRGDATSAPFKMTNDIEINLGDFGEFGNYSAFLRVNSFYDAALDSDDSYERFGLDNNAAKRLAARDIELLDGYISGDYEVFGYPLNLRGGRQVISWGESTFYLGGINVVNPIDVSAFRRPGSEVKDILLPETAIYASMGLPYELTMEAYYLLQWNPYELEPSGTPFQNTDFLYPSGSAVEDRLYLSSSANAGTYRANCSGSPARRAAEVVGALAAQAAIRALGGDPAAPTRIQLQAAAQAQAAVTFPALKGSPTDQGSCAWARAQDAALHAATGSLADEATALSQAGSAYSTAAAAFAAANAASTAAAAAAAAAPDNSALAAAATAAAQAANAALLTREGARAPLAQASSAYRAAYRDAITRHIDRDQDGDPTGRFYDSRSRLFELSPENAERIHRNPWGVNPAGAFPNSAAAIPASIQCQEADDLAACQARVNRFNDDNLQNVMNGLPLARGETLTADQQLYADNFLNRVTELNTMPFTGTRDADDSGQWGIALRWYSEAFGSTEFGFYYQNYHSRVPLAQVAFYETPYVTLSKTGWTSASGAQLNGFGCLAGAGLGANPALASFTSTGPLAALISAVPQASRPLFLDQRGFLTTGTFIDPDIAGLQVTTSQFYTAAVISSAIPTTGATPHQHSARRRL